MGNTYDIDWRPSSPCTCPPGLLSSVKSYKRLKKMTPENVTKDLKKKGFDYFHGKVGNTEYSLSDISLSRLDWAFTLIENLKHPYLMPGYKPTYTGKSGSQITTRTMEEAFRISYKAVEDKTTVGVVLNSVSVAKKTCVDEGEKENWGKTGNTSLIDKPAWEVVGLDDDAVIEEAHADRVSIQPTDDVRNELFRQDEKTKIKKKVNSKIRSFYFKQSGAAEMAKVETEWNRLPKFGGEKGFTFIDDAAKMGGDDPPDGV